MFEYNRYDKVIGHTQRHINSSQLIVSKTDLKGIITYVNPTFLAITGYKTAELVGQNHNISRHPDMPQALYKMVWDALLNGRDIYAYVKNLTKDGSFYWAFAYFTPDLNEEGKAIGYHSERRTPNCKAVEEISLLYQRIKDREIRDGNEAGIELLNATATERADSYESYIFNLQNQF